MGGTRNILFIMCDQLRADYLGVAGHPFLRTPAIDALAAEGVMFTRAFCNAPVCGPSRASFYTGRYAVSHGANYNSFPLRVDEWTLGDYLKPLGLRTVVVGKTHMKPDLLGLQRLGVDPNTDLGIHLAQTGFEPFERDDGLHPDQSADPDLAYNRYLRAQGYGGGNPWHDFANSAEGDDGEILSGWFMRNARLAARVLEQHSETAYMTERAMAFIDAAADHLWCLHLSYIKPHWPYIAPAPYNDIYGPDQLLPANRNDKELTNVHPVTAAFMQHGESECFSQDECRRTVIPTYMGLVRQIDDHLQRLFDFLKARGRWDDTLIVFTSDHGDYLGDHWLGEKELFHEESLRIPMIIRDPSPEADCSRGLTRTEFVESVDLIPTFLEVLGGQIPEHRLEGRSLAGLLHETGPADRWRDAVFSEFDFCLRYARIRLGLATHEARGFMVRTAAWKFVYFPKHPPQLFDLKNDPRELHDRGRDPDCEGIRTEMRDRLLQWFSLRRNRTTYADERVEKATAAEHAEGYLFGLW